MYTIDLGDLSEASSRFEYNGLKYDLVEALEDDYIKYRNTLAGSTQIKREDDKQHTEYVTLDRTAQTLLLGNSVFLVDNGIRKPVPVGAAVVGKWPYRLTSKLFDELLKLTGVLERKPNTPSQEDTSKNS